MSYPGDNGSRRQPQGHRPPGVPQEFASRQPAPQPYAPQPYAQQPDPWAASQDYGQPGFDPRPQYPAPPAGQWQYPPQPQYAPAPPPRRRKRHTARNVIAGIGALIGIIIVVSVAANSGHTVQTAGSTASAGAHAGAVQKTAGIGSAITLTGNSSGEQMAVTVTKAISSATPADSFNGAPSGDRLYAVQFRLADTGTAAYSDSPSNGAAVIDSAGQSYQSGLETVTGCQSFGGTENIAPGSSGLGCIVFEVPKAAKITNVQFTLDSGMGPDTGQWNVG